MCFHTKISNLGSLKITRRIESRLSFRDLFSVLSYSVDSIEGNNFDYRLRVQSYSIIRDYVGTYRINVGGSDWFWQNQSKR